MPLPPRSAAAEVSEAGAVLEDQTGFEVPPAVGGMPAQQIMPGKPAAAMLRLERLRETGHKTELETEEWGPGKAAEPSLHTRLYRQKRVEAAKSEIV